MSAKAPRRPTAHEIFEDYLRQGKLKNTPQRRLILDTFLEGEGHLSSEELYEAVKAREESVGQATVYRTLKLIAAAGLAREVHFGDGVARYEKKYGEEHHDHLICDVCGKTTEVMDERIEQLQEELAERHGFLLTSHRMVLHGLCSDCRQCDAD